LSEQTQTRPQRLHGLLAMQKRGRAIDIGLIRDGKKVTLKVTPE
jgi:hypothetical protein